MQIFWLEDALIDLQSLREYIAQDHKLAAVKIVKKILSVIEILSKQPGMGRPGRVKDTQELIISSTSYNVPYRVKNNRVEILRILHCATAWPKKL